MNNKHLVVVGIAVVFALSLGTGYWVYASSGHGMGNNDRMDGQSQDRSGMMDKGHQSMMGMPMMHGNMSKEEMGRMCERMTQRHARMQSMRQKKTETLNSLVDTMKQAKGTEKIEAMESVLVELVEQHNQRSKMMTGHMRSMMGMHNMTPEKREMMMKRMQDCPMMKGMMKSKEHGTASDESTHHEQQE